MASAADVPGKFDVVINGEGYRFADTVATDALWGSSMAGYSYSPTFVERQNVSGDYGDNQRDFWLTWTQRDWSLGSGQKYYRQDQGRDQRYYYGSPGSDIAIPGAYSIQRGVISTSGLVGIGAVAGQQFGTTNRVLLATTATLRAISDTAAVTLLGSHGAGGLPTTLVVDDAGAAYLCSPGHSVGIVKYNGSFASFSTTDAVTLEFLNNTLFGIKTDGSLIRYDTAGAVTTIYQWKGADGTAWSSTLHPLMTQYGGKLAILLPDGTRHPTIYLYDGGAAPFAIAELPRGFLAKAMLASFGTLFISGCFVRLNTAGAGYDERAAVLYYQNGSLGTLWQAEDYDTARAPAAFTNVQGPGLAEWGGFVCFGDTFKGQVLAYDPTSGGVHGLFYLGAGFDASNDLLMASTATHLLVTAQTTSTQNARIFPDDLYVTGPLSVLQTSLVDFDLSLPKYFKGVTIEADLPAGSSIDIYYQIDGVGGTYTLLRTGAVSGVEYAINASGQAISIQLLLNTNGTVRPTLRRIHVRAVPVLETLRFVSYALDLSGVDDDTIPLRDGTRHTKDGDAMAVDLQTAARSLTPITVTDRLGTFTGIIEPDGFEMRQTSPGEYVAKVSAREI